jgi:hypothetical protein
MTALLRGDTDHGYLLIHQAVQEDIRATGQQRPDRPSYALVSLNYDKVDQAFRQWVIDQAIFFNELIENYASTHRRSLTIEDVKHRFIDIPPSVETVFLLTYTIARLMKIVRLPAHATRNAFAGQLEIDLLFDITLVIDTAIKTKNPNPDQWKFSDHAQHLLAATSRQFTIPQLRNIASQFDNDFEVALEAAIDGRLTVEPNTTLDRLQCDVALAYGLRNRGAHDIRTVPAIWTRFRDVQQTLFCVLCATIDYLY